MVLKQKPCWAYARYGVDLMWPKLLHAENLEEEQYTPACLICSPPKMSFTSRSICATAPSFGMLEQKLCSSGLRLAVRSTAVSVVFLCHRFPLFDRQLSVSPGIIFLAENCSRKMRQKGSIKGTVFCAALIWVGLEVCDKKLNGTASSRPVEEGLHGARILDFQCLLNSRSLSIFSIWEA